MKTPMESESRPLLSGGSTPSKSEMWSIQK
jgi:hypothetical protein